MWLCDVIIDREWLRSNDWRLPSPTAKSFGIARDGTTKLEFRFFADRFRITHLRILIDTKDQNLADKLCDDHVQFWTDSLPLSSLIHTNHLSVPERIIGSLDSLMIVTGAYSDDERVLQIDTNVQLNPPDFESAASLMTGWDSDFRHHLFYAVRFFNWELPIEIRWLSGYRFLEWHFCRGEVKLVASHGWRELLETRSQSLQPLLKPRQTLVGLFEETRALAAHALLASRPSQDLIRETFPHLGALVSTILQEVRVDGLQFRFQA